MPIVFNMDCAQRYDSWPKSSLKFDLHKKMDAAVAANDTLKCYLSNLGIVPFIDFISEIEVEQTKLTHRKESLKLNIIFSHIDPFDFALILKELKKTQLACTTLTFSASIISSGGTSGFFALPYIPNTSVDTYKNTYKSPSIPAKG